MHITLKFSILSLCVLHLFTVGCGDTSECTTDMDCKGDRICSAEGSCAEPGTTQTPTNNTTNEPALELYVSFSDCFTRCMDVATMCGAPNSVAEDICGFNLCRERALTFSEASCLESTQCTVLEGALSGNIDMICGVQLSSTPNTSQPPSQPPASTPSGSMTCGQPGSMCTTGSDCIGYACTCDGKKQIGDLFSCKLKTGFVADGAACPSGADVCKAGAGCPSGTGRVQWDDAGCWGN